MSRKFSIRVLLVLSSVLVLLVLSGCVGTELNTKETSDLANGGFWQKYIVYPLAFSLDWLAIKLWGEYGLSILIVTIAIRLVILPLTLKQSRSSKQMQAIQPELKKLKEKFKDDPKKQQEETMKLFQSNGVNPLAGCMPLIVQMPILIALYNAIVWNPDIRTHSFLWMELGAKDPYFILPLLAAITTYIQQKMMAHQMTSQMQALMYIFPVLIFVMAMNFPSALPLYWVYTNIFTIVQNYFIYGIGGSQQQKGGLSK